MPSNNSTPLELSPRQSQDYEAFIAEVSAVEIGWLKLLSQLTDAQDLDAKGMQEIRRLIDGCGKNLESLVEKRKLFLESEEEISTNRPLQEIRRAISEKLTKLAKLHSKIIEATQAIQESTQKELLRIRQAKQSLHRFPKNSVGESKPPLHEWKG